jgi:chromosomal replication initiation ATPase DnaA
LRFLDDDATVVGFMVPANIWDEIRSRIQGKVNRVSYDIWFLPTAFVADDDRSVTVRVPSALFRDWIVKHYSSLIAQALDDVRRSDARIGFTVAESPDAETEERVMPSPDAGFHSIDNRFDRVDHELGALRRDAGLILARLSST